MTIRELFILHRESFNELLRRLERIAPEQANGATGWLSPLIDIKMFASQIEWQLRSADRDLIGPRQQPPIEAMGGHRESFNELLRRLERIAPEQVNGATGWLSPLIVIKMFASQIEWQLRAADRDLIGPRQPPPLEAMGGLARCPERINGRDGRSQAQCVLAADHLCGHLFED